MIWGRCANFTTFLKSGMPSTVEDSFVTVNIMNFAIRFPLWQFINMYNLVNITVLSFRAQIYSSLIDTIYIQCYLVFIGQSICQRIQSCSDWCFLVSIRRACDGYSTSVYHIIEPSCSVRRQFASILRPCRVAIGNATNKGWIYFDSAPILLFLRKTLTFKDISD